MARKRTQMYADGQTYSMFDPEEVHRDLRMDHVRAQVVLSRSKGVAEAHEFCDECRVIARELEDTDQAPSKAGGFATLDEAILAHTERRVQWVISRANLAKLLGLARGERIQRMYLSDDPQALHVIVTGEHYPPVADGADTPTVKVSRSNTAATAAAEATASR